MSTPNKTGASRRLRTAGLALFGLAVVAVLIGLLLAVNREEHTTATGQPPATPTQAPPSTSASPTVIPYPPPVPSIPAEAPGVTVSEPPDAAAGAPIGDAGSSRGEVRVYNNSTIRGLAARAADDLTAAGWMVVDVGNYAQGIISTTTVYYQEGTEEQAFAEEIGAEFGIRVEPRFPGIANADPGVIVIVTNDYPN
ncbi:MAG: LytR C-terminal domain-containing protein [Actinomycetota bacterium]|nr:LytR C-terminal domain-containing protein [Actinomycetota bacterium]